MLTFGPQEPCPSSTTMHHLRHALQHDPALHDLPAFWNVLVQQDERLRAFPGAATAAVLRSWLEDYHDHKTADATANRITMPLTVIMHLVQYRQYLQQFSDTTHASIMKDVAQGGVQGFCAGLLSAYAVASMKSEKDFGACSSAAIKVAMCIGAYVDLEMISSGQRVVSAIVRWSSKDSRQQVESTLAGYTNVSDLYSEVSFSS